ncbi:MAG: cobalt-precorrin 5A hydrolase [Thermodesulfobacteriota bacterium]
MGQTEAAPVRIAVCAVTKGGSQLARTLVGALAGAELLDCRAGIAVAVQRAWPVYDGFVCIMAAGIVVRTIAPLISDKRHDPAIVVCDERGRFAVSLLSGHVGGGNGLALRVAEITGGQAVITTASDVLGLTALDLWMRKTGLIAEQAADVTRLSAILVNRGRLRVFCDTVVPELPQDLLEVADAGEADCIVSNRTGWTRADALVLRPKNLVVGIGCNRGTAAADIGEALVATLEENQLSSFSLHSLATIDLKADEEGLLAAARGHGLPLVFFAKEELNRVEGVARSEAVFRATGAYAVAEPAALLAAGQGGRLIVPKRKYRDVTVAIVEKYL